MIHTDKKWHDSKKFLAFLIMELLLAGLAGFALWKQPGLGWPLSMFMTFIVVTMGAVAFGFNGQQAALDKYMRGAAIALANASKNKEDEYDPEKTIS